MQQSVAVNPRIASIGMEAGMLAGSIRLYANVSNSRDPETETRFSRNRSDTCVGDLTGHRTAATDNPPPPLVFKGDENVDVR
jgi:hypothetical protein